MACAQSTLHARRPWLQCFNLQYFFDPALKILKPSSAFADADAAQGSCLRRRLFFASQRAGPNNLFVQAADGTGAITRLTENPNAQSPTSVSPDGTRLIFTETMPKTGEDLMDLRLDRTPSTPEPLVQTPFAERNGEVSPDGRWLAYQANDSGSFERFPT